MILIVLYLIHCYYCLCKIDNYYNHFTASANYKLRPRIQSTATATRIFREMCGDCFLPTPISCTVLHATIVALRRYPNHQDPKSRGNIFQTFSMKSMTSVQTITKTHTLKDAHSYTILLSTKSIICISLIQTLERPLFDLFSSFASKASLTIYNSRKTKRGIAGTLSKRRSKYNDQEGNRDNLIHIASSLTYSDQVYLAKVASSDQSSWANIFSS